MIKVKYESGNHQDWNFGFVFYKYGLPQNDYRLGLWIFKKSYWLIFKKE